MFTVLTFTNLKKKVFYQYEKQNKRDSGYGKGDKSRVLIAENGFHKNIPPIFNKWNKALLRGRRALYRTENYQGGAYQKPKIIR